MKKRADGLPSWIPFAILAILFLVGMTVFGAKTYKNTGGTVDNIANQSAPYLQNEYSFKTITKQDGKFIKITMELEKHERKYKHFRLFVQPFSQVLNPDAYFELAACDHGGCDGKFNCTSTDNLGETCVYSTDKYKTGALAKSLVSKLYQIEIEAFIDNEKLPRARSRSIVMWSKSLVNP